MGRSPHLPRFGRETEADLAIVERAMNLANVSHIAERPITEISGGERQRAFIAMCLAQEPQVLLLDEPTSHLDIGHQLSILDLIRNLNRKTRMTVVAVFHDLNLAAEYCDRLVLLNRGRVAATGTPVEVLTTEMIHEVYGADVLVGRNPTSGCPHIIMSANWQPGIEQRPAILCRN
jgi:iron complex transport system ATP-binding protein